MSGYQLEYWNMLSS